MTSQEKKVLHLAPAMPPLGMPADSRAPALREKAQTLARAPPVATRGQGYHTTVPKLQGHVGNDINSPNGLAPSGGSEWDNNHITTDDKPLNNDDGGEQDDHGHGHENDVVIQNAQVVDEDETAEDLEAVLAAQLAEQVKQQVEAQLQAHREETYAMADAVVATKINASSDSHHSSTKRFLILLTLVVVVLVIVGIVAGVVISSSSDDNDNSSVSSKQFQQQLGPWIVRNDEDGLGVFDNPTSPQYLALKWLSSDPIALSTTSSADISFQALLERYVVAVLYYSTDGRNWDENDALFTEALMSDRDTCAWNNGADPLVDDTARGFFCDEGTDVMKYIRLNNLNLVGTIPWELSLLSNLARLIMQANSLSGTLPTELSKLSILETFWLSANKLLTGPLPPTLPASVRSVDLSSNSFTGTIPTNWGESRSNLFYLYLEDNKLSGTIPTEIGEWTHLKQIYIRDNALSGTLPTELGTLTNLYDLQFHQNGLTGTIPSEFGMMTALNNIYMSGNKLVGTLPTEMGLLLNLTDLQIHENELTGTVPTQLAQLTKLTVFTLFKNHLKGSLDDTLCASPQQWINPGLQSDCLADNGGPAEIECSCCTACCNEAGDYCPNVVDNDG